mmetsp:Transcript_1054/g.3016  ORF Transcript_1054/g.3016 Transcript_1054/m.3016 type:complete len:293 (+) Transcript_1054:413-1291(+)
MLRSAYSSPAGAYGELVSPSSSTRGATSAGGISGPAGRRDGVCRADTPLDFAPSPPLLAPPTSPPLTATGLSSRNSSSLATLMAASLPSRSASSSTSVSASVAVSRVPLSSLTRTTSSLARIASTNGTLWPYRGVGMVASTRVRLSSSAFTTAGAKRAECSSILPISSTSISAVPCRASSLTAGSAVASTLGTSTAHLPTMCFPLGPSVASTPLLCAHGAPRASSGAMLKPVRGPPATARSSCVTNPPTAWPAPTAARTAARHAVVLPTPGWPVTSTWRAIETSIDQICFAG